MSSPRPELAPHPTTNRVRRSLAGGLALALGMTMAGAALPTEPAAASLVDDGFVTWVAPNIKEGPQSTTWKGLNNKTAPDSFRFEVPGSWKDIRYTLIGASGSSAGKGLKIRGGLGAIVKGTVPADVLELHLGWGLRGGAGEGDSQAGSSGSPVGFHGGSGGYGYGTNYEGGGGGGSSYISIFATDATRTFYAVAGGGGGASGGYELDMCHGASGGDSGSRGGDSPSVPGVFPALEPHCQEAHGGAAGGPTTSFEPNGRTGNHAPGSGGGGGGITAGQSGAVVAGRAAISASGSAGGGAGGGGGGSSAAHGDSSATFAIATDEYRGDGQVILDYYVAHEIDLTASLSGEYPLEVGYTQHIDFTLEAPSNAPAAELNLDGIVTVTLNGEGLTSRVSGQPVTGTIAGGLDVVLPASSSQPHKLCLTYTPASDKLRPAPKKCFDISIANNSTPLKTYLFPVGTMGFINNEPRCGLIACVLVPAMAEGPWLHPRVGLVDGIDLGGEAPLEPTTISLQWRDLTSNESGEQIIGGAALATKPGIFPIDQPPARLPIVDGTWWPYTYLNFLPNGHAPEVGHAYRIGAEWADAGMFTFAKSAEVTFLIVPSPSTLTAQFANDTVSVGNAITFTATALGTPGNTLPTCCGPDPLFLGNRLINGDFKVTLTNNNDPDTVITEFESTGTGISRNTWPALESGAYSLAVEFTSASPAWNNATKRLNLTVTKASTQVSVVVDPSSAQYGTSRELTAQVTAPGAAIQTPLTGQVTFELEQPGGILELGTGDLRPDGSTTVVIDATNSALILPGNTEVIATYSGDGFYAGSYTRQLLTTTPELPVITSGDATSFTAGINGSFEVTTTGVPDATLSIEGDLPAGITLTDHGDGTGELSGTTNDYGIHTVNIVASNNTDTSTDALQTFTLTVTVPAVLLPLEGPPASTGTLTGVPTTSIAGQTFTVTGTGFAPLAPVAFGLYSQLHPLGTATADNEGVVTTTLTIPDGPVGTHTVTAAGMDPTLTPQHLTADTTIATPPGLLATSGPVIIPLVLLMSILLGLGVVAAGWRRPVSL